MKSRFDGLDVFAMVCHLRRTLLGSKVVNIYDGDEGSSSGGDNHNNTTYAFKLDAPNHGSSNNNNHNNNNSSGNRKTFLVLQSGIRFHDIEPPSSSEEDDEAGGSGGGMIQSYANTQPSPFCSKLRKHLRHSRLEQIQQIGQLDRVVLFTFLGASQTGSSSSSSCSLILELYSKGNLILTNDRYEILALLRSHVYQCLPSSSSMAEAANTTQQDTTKNNDDKDKGENKKGDKGDSSNNTEQVQVRVGKIYPVTYATTSTLTATKKNKENDDKNDDGINDNNNNNNDGDGILSQQFGSWIYTQLQQEREKKQQQALNQNNANNGGGGGKKKKIANQQIIMQPNHCNKPSAVSTGFSLTLKTLLLRNSSGVSHYGPALLEHVILCTDHLSPHQPLLLDDDDNDNNKNDNNNDNNKNDNNNNKQVEGAHGKEPTNDKKTKEEKEETLSSFRPQKIAGLQITDWENLRNLLQTEAPAVLERLQKATDQETSGYIFYKDVSPFSKNKNDNVTNGKMENQPLMTTKAPQQQQHQQQQQTILGLPHPDKTLTEFQPHLLKQHESLRYIKTRHFGRAVSDFFAQLQAQKRSQKAKQAEHAVSARLHNIQLDQEQRVQALKQEILLCQQRAMAVEQNATKVDQALQVVNSALDSGMDWDQLEQVVLVEQEEHLNPIALLIQELQLDQDQMILSLPVIVEHEDDDDDNNQNDTTDNDGGEEDEGNDHDGPKSKSINVPVVLHETAHANASRLFAQYRASKEKSRKTLEASSKALQAAQVTAERQLAAAQAKQKQRGGGTTTGHSAMRKMAWFEKFHWMITRDNYLVLAGRDAHQNEVLVKRYLRPGDAYLHADVHGAASCILRAKRQRMGEITSSGHETSNNNNSNNNDKNRSKPLPLSEQALVEAGQFTICHSSAWASRMVTSAWWVESHQVSKTAPTGEYLTVGSFMIRGKKTYLPPTPLEMGLAVLFRLGDAESIARHKDKDRRDFQLLFGTMDQKLTTTITNEEGEIGNSTVTTKTRTTTDNDENDNGTPSSNDNMSNPVIIQNTKQPSEGIGQKEEEDERENDVDNDDEAEDMELEDDTQQEGDKSITKEKNGDGPTLVTEEENDGETENAAIDTEIEGQQEKSLEATNDRREEAAAEEGSMVGITGSTKRKGFSVRDRKLIKKYGSLEEAERVLAKQQNNSITTEARSLDRTDTMSDRSSTTELTPSLQKRGKKSKLKRQKKKYGDQDEEDRELALMLLHGGGNKDKGGKNKNTKNMGPQTKMEEEVGAATVAVLVKDSESIAASLPSAVKYKLIQCLGGTGGTANSNDTEEQCSVEQEVGWGRIDGTVVEQLVALQPEEAQLATVNRLLSLKEAIQVDNLTMSLAGILRTIRKYGHKNLLSNKQQIEPRNGGKQQQQQQHQDNENEEPDGSLVDEIDDTVELAKLTGKPLPEDVLLCAVPVCAPYNTLSQYQYRVKLTPGNGKRGKAAKQCVEFMLQQPPNGTNKNGNQNLTVPNPTDLFRDLIKRVSDNDWVQTIIPDVKISAAGSSKLMKQQQQQKGTGGKKKK